MALASLQNARPQLMMGTADKGGHRIMAINHGNQGIAQVNLAILYDNVN